MYHKVLAKVFIAKLHYHPTLSSTVTVTELKEDSTYIAMATQSHATHNSEDLHYMHSYLVMFQKE